MKVLIMSVSFLMLLSCAGSVNTSKVNSNYTFYVECDSTQDIHKFQLSRIDSLPFLTGKLWNSKFHDTLIALSHSRDTLLVMCWNKGKKVGTAQLWFHPKNTNGIHQLKLIVNYVEDKIDGEKISYWPNGRMRTKYLYNHGQLISAEGWDPETGEQITDFIGKTNCMKQALIDEELDNNFYKSYYDLVFSKKPICHSFK